MRPALFFISLLCLAACHRMSEVGSPGLAKPRSMPGLQALESYGCAGCHVIPGLEHRSYVAPDLTHLALRGYIGAGTPNNPENVVRWIMNPQAVDPHAAMPNLYVTESAAREMAAYLYGNEANK